MSNLQKKNSHQFSYVPNVLIMHNNTNGKITVEETNNS